MIVRFPPARAKSFYMRMRVVPEAKQRTRHDTDSTSAEYIPNLLAKPTDTMNNTFANAVLDSYMWPKYTC
eukprot:5827535-Pyramimonas_sp.AAC.1